MIAVAKAMRKRKTTMGRFIVSINGSGSEFPFNLYPGESIWLQSDGMAWNVVN
jgi:hypothetical protein